jgi:hypothetical protein
MQIEKMPTPGGMFSSFIAPSEESGGAPAMVPRPDYVAMFGEQALKEPARPLPDLLPEVAPAEQPEMRVLKLGRKERGLETSNPVPQPMVPLNPTPALELPNLILLDTGEVNFCGEQLTLSRVDITKIRHLLAKAIAKNYRAKARGLEGSFGPMYQERRKRGPMQTRRTRRISNVPTVSKKD